jgi:hypothetical protein
MAGDVRVLVAPAAATRLDAARAWLAALPRDAPALVVAPGWEACDDLAREVTRAAGARFGIVRLTLDRLALRLAVRALAARADAAGRPRRRRSSRAVHRLRAANDLGRFTPVASHPGLPQALGRTLDELRLAGIDADALRALEPFGPDLARVAGAVAHELAADRLADRALVLETARDAVASPDAAGLAGVPLLLLDVPLATVAEEALVAALAARAPRVLATAVTGDVRTIAALGRACGAEPEPAAVPTATSLDRLHAFLFDDTTPPSARSTTAAAAAAGRARRCVEIARDPGRDRARRAFDRWPSPLHAVRDYTHLEGFARRRRTSSRAARRPRRRGARCLRSSAAPRTPLRARVREYLSLNQVPEARPSRTPIRSCRPRTTSCRPSRRPSTTARENVPVPIPAAPLRRQHAARRAAGRAHRRSVGDRRRPLATAARRPRGGAEAKQAAAIADDQARRGSPARS